MGKRILVAVVFIPVILLVIFGIAPLHPAVLPAAIAVLSVIAIHEVLWATGLVRERLVTAASLVLAALIPFWVFLGGSEAWAMTGLWVYVVLLFIAAIHSRKTLTTEQMGGAFFFSVFIPFFLSSFVRIRAMEEWRFLIMLPFVAAFLSDAFALFAGMLFGRHKLAPELSPKKTVEGAVGGFVGAVVSLLVYGAVLQLGFGLGVSYPRMALYGALGSLVSQLGDLAFSYIKREYGIKDYGKIFPGHGGVLDRFDSVIFCAPLIEVLVRCLPAISF
ncbi:phosphatidate cytidylyltransferase [Pseudoflavonifractor sp. MSJ-37]|uniref:phosphatidate cytidylyltransferase n=1 Tax=Pseudoflavonifractor sp. MSJ-37 TaxID=2841531 RepID=UPI001C10C161|nr:phosphatidate cytidylyltransferase [Pseudoflavonifractor sp. MSJ-37]MBU5434644.1 phosphatidate cytidylyltransferase [Pseudoflavonifractor sp. MSJ-37]